MINRKSFFFTVSLFVSGIVFSIPFSVLAFENINSQSEEANMRTRTGNYDSCDVDHDGDVDIIDVICVSHYLNGVEDVTVPVYLDADCDKIISASDFQCVLASLVELSFSRGYIYN